MLGGCMKGAPPKLLRNAARACVLPTITFAAEAWWKLGSKGFISQVNRLNSEWCKALRAAIPTYRTTSKGLVHHFAGMPPLDLLLDHAIRLHALRLRRLDQAHPLRSRCKTASDYKGTRLHLAWTLLPDRPETADPLRHPPW